MRLVRAGLQSCTAPPRAGSGKSEQAAEVLLFSILLFTVTEQQKHACGAVLSSYHSVSHSKWLG